jgi:hypothetical protein
MSTTALLWVLLVGRSHSDAVWAFAAFRTEADCRAQAALVEANREHFHSELGDFTTCQQTPVWSKPKL